MNNDKGSATMPALLDDQKADRVTVKERQFESVHAQFLTRVETYTNTWKDTYSDLNDIDATGGKVSVKEFIALRTKILNAYVICLRY